MDPLLAGGEPRFVGPELANDPGPDAAVPNPNRRLANDLVGEIGDRAAVDQGFGRVVRVAVPAAAHDEVKSGCTREAGEPLRVAPDARQRQVDDRGATRGREFCELLDDHALVPSKLPVVPAIGDMPEGNCGVLVGKSPAQLPRIDPAENGLDAGRRGRGVRHDATRGARADS